MIRDFKPIKGVDFDTVGSLFGDARSASNAGFDSLSAILANNRKNKIAAYGRQTDANDLAIQSGMDQFKTYADLQRAQEEGKFSISDRSGQYGKQYTQSKSDAAYEARKKLLGDQLVNDRISSSLDSGWQNKGMNADIQRQSIEDLPLELANRVNAGRRSGWDSRTALNNRQTQLMGDRTKQNEFERQAITQQFGSEVATAKAAYDSQAAFNPSAVLSPTGSQDLSGIVTDIAQAPEGAWFQGGNKKLLTNYRSTLETQLAKGPLAGQADAVLAQAYTNTKEGNRRFGTGGVKIDLPSIKKAANQIIIGQQNKAKAQSEFLQAQAKQSKGMNQFNSRKAKELAGYRDSFTFGSPKDVVTMTPEQQIQAYGKPNIIAGQEATIKRMASDNQMQPKRTGRPAPTVPPIIKEKITDDLTADAVIEKSIGDTSGFQGSPLFNQKEVGNPLNTAPVVNWFKERKAENARKVKQLKPGEYATAANEEQLRNQAKGAFTIPGNTRAKRNNNPGNLRVPGSKTDRDGFTIFKNTTDGVEGFKKDLRIKLSGKSSTGITKGSSLAEYIEVYAPSSENDTAEYITDVSRWLGLPATTTIGDIPFDALVSSMLRRESGTTRK